MATSEFEGVKPENALVVIEPSIDLQPAMSQCEQLSTMVEAVSRQFNEMNQISCAMDLGSAFDAASQQANQMGKAFDYIDVEYTEVEECAQRAGGYRWGLLVQYSQPLADPFDYETMEAAGRRHRSGSGSRQSSPDRGQHVSRALGSAHGSSGVRGRGRKCQSIPQKEIEI